MARSNLTQSRQQRCISFLPDSVALLVSMCFSPNDSIITILIAVFLMMTLGFRFWWVALLLLMVQVGLFLAEPGSVSGYSNSPGSSLVSIGVLVLLISCSRYLTLTSSPAPFRLSNRLSARVAYLHATREPPHKICEVLEWSHEMTQRSALASFSQCLPGP